MADLTELQASGSTKIAGASSSGVEDNFAEVTAAQALKVDGSAVTQPVVNNDTSPANGSITALDTGTSNLTGANGQVFYFGTPTTNSAASFALSSIDSVSIQANLLGAGGTLVVEVSMDGGSFWLRPNVFQISTQNYTNSFTAPFIATLNVSGLTNVRVRAITSWSGTAAIIVKETVNPRSVTLGDSLPGGSNNIGSITNVTGTVSLPTGASTSALQTTISSTLSTISGQLPATLGSKLTANSLAVNIASDQTVPISAVSLPLPTGAATSANQSTEIAALQLIDNPVGSATGGTAGTSSYLVGGVYNSTIPTLTNGQQASLQLDASGRLMTLSSPSDGVKATYSATSAIAFASPLLATDIFTITGSATKTVRVLRLAYSAQQTTAGVDNILVIKRSTANTGGTSASATRVPHDSNDAAATATVLNYTANPTLGTAVGTVRAARMFIPTAGTDISTFVYEYDFGALPEKAIVLRGTGEVLAINLNGATISGGTWTCFVEWTEE